MQMENKMKKTLTYEFSDDECSEEYEFNIIVSAHKYRAALDEIRNILRNYRKYDDLSKYTIEQLFHKIDQEIMNCIPLLDD